MPKVQYKCGKCGKSFPSSQALKVHKYFKHNDVNPFVKRPAKPGPKRKKK